MKNNRVVNEELINLFETYYSRSVKPLILMYEAPTGYGKTTIAPYHGYYAYKYNISYGYIHVLPMRSMVYKLYQDYTDSNIFKKELLNQYLHGLTTSEQGVCYQASGLTIFGKNPFLSCLLNFTTFDSFFLNLIRMGIGERSILTRHHETSRLMIFTSTVSFDEVHLYGGDPGSPETIMYNNFMLSLQAVLYSRSPVNILSATLPSKLSDELYNTIKDFVNLGMCFLRINYGEKVLITPDSCIPKINLQYSDPEYDSKAGSVKWKNRLMCEKESINEIISDIKEKYLNGLKILIVVNKPERAVRINKKLEEFGVNSILIHGRLKHIEREEREEKISDTKVLVATQVVEAGIDVDYDVLYTDIAPPSNLIQRAGRINRYFEKEDGEVNIIIHEDAYKYVYKDDIIVKTIDYLKKNIELINWRKTKCNGDKCKGYKEFLDEVYENINVDKQKTVTGMLLDYILQALLPIISYGEIRKTFLKTCYDERGIARSSLLIPLIHIEEDTDVRYLTWEELYKNTIPASLTWIHYNANNLFEKNVKAVFITEIGEEASEFGVDVLEIDRCDLKERICKFLIGEVEGLNKDSRKGFFIGLLVKKNAYKEGLGLLV